MKRNDLHSTHWQELAKKLATRFKERASTYDAQGTVPTENIDALRDHQFLSLTVPRKYGGAEASLTTVIAVLEQLAKGDASTALGLGWHLGMFLNLRSTNQWPQQLFARVCTEVVRDQVLLNVVATEPATGSPSRGGRPETVLEPVADGWQLNGRKTWSTMSPLLRYAVVTASIATTEEVAEVLVPLDAPGVRLEETWDSMAMRATGSHDLHFEGVPLPADALIERRLADEKSVKASDGSGWLLHIPACYLGIATAAKEYATTFASTYQPNTLPEPIAHLPDVQRKIGQMELQTYTARTVLYEAARAWDQLPAERNSQRAGRAAAKYVVTNGAIEIVDYAMRIVGGRSLLRAYPLERFYRDVRAGLHHPPMDDVTLKMLANKALADVASERPD